MSRLLNEPVLIATAIRACILAGTAFGLNWTGEQIASDAGGGSSDSRGQAVGHAEPTRG